MPWITQTTSATIGQYGTFTLPYFPSTNSQVHRWSSFSSWMLKNCGDVEITSLGGPPYYHRQALTITETFTRFGSLPRPAVANPSTHPKQNLPPAPTKPVSFPDDNEPPKEEPKEGITPAARPSVPTPEPTLSPKAQLDSSKPDYINIKEITQNQANPLPEPKTNLQGQPGANRPQPNGASSPVPVPPAGVETAIANPAVPASYLNLPPVTLDGKVVTPDSPSQPVPAGKNPEAGQEIQTPGVVISLALSGEIIYIGEKKISLNSPNLNPTSVLTVDNEEYTADSASRFILQDNLTLLPGSQVTLSGSVISLTPSATQAVIAGSLTIQPVKAPEAGPPILTQYDQTFTRNTDSTYAIQGQTLTPGSQISPPASVLIEGGGSYLPVIVIESPSPTSIPPAPLHVSGRKPIYPNVASEYIIGSQTLVPGGPGITISNTLVSLAPSASALVIGTKTIPFITTPPVSKNNKNASLILPTLTIGDQTITPNAASQYLINNKTLIPGGPEITISNTLVSLAPSASALIIGIKTIPLGPPNPLLSTLTIGDQTLIQNAASQYLVNDKTLVPGSPGITISNNLVSPAPSASALVIGTKTLSLAIASGSSSSMQDEEGLGRLILEGLGFVLSSSSSTLTPANTTGRIFRGNSTSTLPNPEIFRGSASSLSLSLSAAGKGQLLLLRIIGSVLAVQIICMRL